MADTETSSQVTLGEIHELCGRYRTRGVEHVTIPGATKNSMDQVADKLVGRGTLLDIPRHRGLDMALCRDRGEWGAVYDFLFTGPPLPFAKAVGSPLDPLAIDEVRSL